MVYPSREREGQRCNLVSGDRLDLTLQLVSPLTLMYFALKEYPVVINTASLMTCCVQIVDR